MANKTARAFYRGRNVGLQLHSICTNSPAVLCFFSDHFISVDISSYCECSICMFRYRLNALGYHMLNALILHQVQNMTSKRMFMKSTFQTRSIVSM